jgi:quercetin dioxygenase-like cupin family protein
MGEIIDGSIAYLEKDGSGPLELHTHEHNHLFIVVKGEAKIFLNNEKVIVHENESYLVKGCIPHSVWNNLSEATIMFLLRKNAIIPHVKSGQHFQSPSSMVPSKPVILPRSDCNRG